MRLNEVALHVELKRLKDLAEKIGVVQPYAHMDGMQPKVDAHGHVVIRNSIMKSLPIVFGHALRDFDIISCDEIEHLKGFPKTVENSSSIRKCAKLHTLKGVENTTIKNTFTLEDLPSLESLEFLPRAKSFAIVRCGNVLKDLRGIEKHLKFLVDDGAFSLGLDEVERGGIGLIMVENLRYIFNQNITAHKIRNRNAFEIIRKYVGQPDKLYDCQTELIEQGLDEFAEL